MPNDAANDANIVWLKVNGTDFGGWKKVSITAGLDRQARDFDLGVTSRWPGSTDVPRRIRPFDACQVLIGSDLVLTGSVDATPINYDGRSLSVGVKGRSKTADLVDCSAVNEPGQWKNVRVEVIVRALLAFYGVELVVEVDTGPPVSDFQIDQGETVFDAIDRLISARGLLCTDDGRGRAVLTRTGKARASTPLVFGDNILSGDAPLDWKDRYSEYRIKGQATGDDANHTASVNALAVETDRGVPRRRVLIKKQTGDASPATARLEARWEAANRAGKSLKATYAVQGWRQQDGSLWRPNMLVRVSDPVVGFDDDLLIGEVTYSLDDSGMVCRLTVAPPGAWELKPEQQDKSKSAALQPRPGETVVTVP